MLFCTLLVLVALESGEVRVYKDKVLCNVIETPVSLLSIELHLSFPVSQIPCESIIYRKRLKT